jgi:hypothetical protein
MKIYKTELAMPQLIPQDQLSMQYVNKWKADAEKALRLARNITLHKLEPEYQESTLYHWAKSSTSGVWFISLDGKSVDYLYAYQSIRLDNSGQHKAAEALAYLFNPSVRGVTKGVFFNHLLPSQKFVVTDFMYTPDGHRWFEAEYVHAFGLGYKVYAIDMTGKTKLEQITEEQFWALQTQYWGLDAKHQKYRFAIKFP